jgi:hypothetical protein
MFAETPLGSNEFGWGAHPYRDQVHSRLAQFRPRARNPRICQGGSGLPAAVTISTGFGYVVSLARETGSES